VLVSDFNFHLPQQLIAQEPLAERAGSRLLHLDAATGSWRDRQFREFPELLRGDDLVVFNNTRVFPARLYGRRRESEGRIEVLLTRQISLAPNEWECLVRPGRKIRVGDELIFGEQDELQAEVVGRGEFGERRIRFGEIGTSATTDKFYDLLEKIGHVPLPPYIARADSAGDRERYQTVYARERGSVAAPTAGLHFTPEILARMRERAAVLTQQLNDASGGLEEATLADYALEVHRVQDSTSSNPSTFT